MKTSICALRSGGQLFCVAVVEGRIKPQGELITHDGKTYDIENLKNLGTDWIGKQIQVAGYVSKPVGVPSGDGAGRDTIEVSSYHVLGSSTRWHNCVTSCEPQELCPS